MQFSGEFRNIKKVVKIKENKSNKKKQINYFIETHSTCIQRKSKKKGKSYDDI